MLRTNTVFSCHRNEIIARLKEDFGYETHLPLTGPIGLLSEHSQSFRSESERDINVMENTCAAYMFVLVANK